MLGVLLLLISLTVTGNCQSNTSDLVDFINNLNTTWTAQINFANSTDEQMPLICDRMNLTNISMQEVTLMPTIPSQFDARIQWSHCQTIHSIYHQGRCGSCWV